MHRYVMLQGEMKKKKEAHINIIAWRLVPKKVDYVSIRRGLFDGKKFLE